MIETRTRWEATMEPPEGWRPGIGEFDKNGDYWRLWTDAPSDKNPHLHNIKWIRSRAVRQQRIVGEWMDIE